MGADFDDKRLDRRLTRIVADLAHQPTASIPAACGGHAEMTAAYRFFDNPKVTPQRILLPHIQQTTRRIAEQPLVLLVQDTTEADLTRPNSTVAGAGPLDGSRRRGLFLHLMVAFTPDATPLGTVAAEFWKRPQPTAEPPPRLTSDEQRRLLKQTPIEEKESYRWLQGLRRARQIAQATPQTKCVCVADSEADIYEVLAEPRGEENPVEWLIRASYDRAVLADQNSLAGHLRATAAAGAVLWTEPITVRGRQAKTTCEKRARRQPRTDRTATVEARAVAATLRPPVRSDRRLAPVRVQVVLVSEVDPPPGEEAVEWLLITTLPIGTVEQVRQVIDAYKARWMIEVFFRTLKSGCRVEDRLFEAVDRLEACLAVYLIVAWRVLLISRLARSLPEASCELVFAPSEWQAVCRVLGHPTDDGPPSLNRMVRLVARLGGYIDRPRGGPPGPQTLWLGLQRAYDFARCWDLFGPGAAKSDV